ncbi:MAG: glutamine-hydrolyzing carbamoyl-phosphate synthase small subunit [Chloroflexota bacterium]|nr:glutamine-hydrolyzing carbamoyl-phosphate synthase small subunit [Chloroflexota bacterium]MDQ5866123.1 glutamine-hydrolyzing carbamoyl-phosphate synthase small subunit [Chloroflexota bacterium]
MGETLLGLLVMSDGTVVRGLGGGAPGLTVGELVFQTGMVGYQEALTDPSYAGQILIFTYPLVGNYGVGEAGNQSHHIHPRAVITHELMASSGHRSSSDDLDEMLRAQGVPALFGVDTRMLTRKVRMHGVIPAALAVAPEGQLPTVAELQSLAASLDYDSVDFVVECTTPQTVWHPPSNPDGPRVVLVDYGSKQAILDYLLEGGAGVWRVPATTTAEEILALQPDGVLLSNGPGDPARLDYAVSTVCGLLDNGRVPVFGICLGHQLLSLAAGGRTSKMRFGHRGINQPVLEVATGRVSITTQNHGYMVEPGSIPAEYVVTHTNLNDGSIEGIAHVSRAVWGVQWHPEAHPGPADTRQLFDRFLQSREVAHA